MASNTGTASLAGHIFRADDGAPLAGATVSLVPKPVPGALVFSSQQTAISTANGACAFGSLAAGEYFVQVESSGFVTARRQGPISVGAGESVADADIRLQRAGSISGSVYDHEGDPLQGMLITLFYRSFASGAPPARVMANSDAVTDDQGNFRVRNMIPGTCYVVASTVPALVNPKGDPTYYPSAPSTDGATLVQIKPGEETPGIRITLPQSLSSIASPSNSTGASGSISGHVYRADSGAPLAGAIAFLGTIPDMRKSMQIGPPMPAPAVIARTDANGAYEFQSLSPGRYTVSAQRQGFMQTDLSAPAFAHKLQQIELSKKPVKNIDGRLQPASVIAGKVTDTTGRPISGMIVSIVRRAATGENGDFARLASATTDEQGRYRAQVAAPGDYYVTAGQPPAFRAPAFAYARAYYPQAASPDQAQAIHVDPAAPQSSICSLLRLQA